MRSEIRESEAKLSKGDRTRLKLIEGAVRCFARLGFDGASFSEIAKVTKLHKSQVNYYLKDRDGLILECGRHVFSARSEFLRQYMASLPKESIVIQYIRANFEFFEKNKAHAQFLLMFIQRASYDRKVAQAIERFYAEGKDIVSSWLAEEYRMADDKMGEVSSNIHSVMFGFLLNWLSFRGEDRSLFEERCVDTVKIILSNYSLKTQ